MGKFIGVQPRIDKYTFKDPCSECWLWSGPTSAGYASLTVVGKDQEGKRRVSVLYVHRVNYEKYKGPIPDGMLIRHTCDNPLCVSPDHALVGTHRDNTMDMVSRNRGHLFPRVLNDEQRSEIRRASANGEMSQRELGRKYEVTQRAIWSIIHGQ